MKKLLLFAFLALFISSLSAQQTNKWTGEVNNDWFVPGNWSLGTVPEKDNIIVPASTKDNIILSGGISFVINVEIEDGAGIIIMPTGVLVAFGTITNNGDIYIHSDFEGNSGMFLDYGILEGTGHFSFTRNMGETYPNYTDPRGWHFVGTPISPFGGEDILDIFLNLWDEPTDQYIHIEGSEPCVAVDYTWTPLQGMSMKLDLNYACPDPGTGGIINFAGNFTDLHTGPISGNYTAEGTTMPEHWNLMANPYPSSLFIPFMIFPPSLNASVYQWDGDNETWKSYVGGVGKLFIAPTQAFFVSAISNGTLTVDNWMRGFCGQWLKDEIQDLIALQASGYGYEDIAYIRFLDKATVSFDRDWDAYKLLSSVEEVPQIYTTSNDIMYSIQSRPATSILPLSFKSGQDGLFTIEVIEANDINDVMLEDILTGEEINILEESYTFNHTVGNEAARFLLHFNTLGTIDQLAEIANIYSKDQNIIVNLPKTYNGEIIVFNMMGQEVTRQGIVQGLNSIPVRENNSYYVVQVVTSQETISSKVFVK
jgi:hypothetical protein